MTRPFRKKKATPERRSIALGHRTTFMRDRTQLQASGASTATSRSRGRRAAQFLSPRGTCLHVGAGSLTSPPAVPRSAASQPIARVRVSLARAASFAAIRSADRSGDCRLGSALPGLRCVLTLCAHPRKKLRAKRGRRTLAACLCSAPRCAPHNIVAARRRSSVVASPHLLGGARDAQDPRVERR